MKYSESFSSIAFAILCALSTYVLDNNMNNRYDPKVLDKTKAETIFYNLIKIPQPTEPLNLEQLINMFYSLSKTIDINIVFTDNNDMRYYVAYQPMNISNNYLILYKKKDSYSYLINDEQRAVHLAENIKYIFYPEGVKLKQYIKAMDSNAIDNEALKYDIDLLLNSKNMKRRKKKPVDQIYEETFFYRTYKEFWK